MCTNEVAFLQWGRRPITVREYLSSKARENQFVKHSMSRKYHVWQFGRQYVRNCDWILWAQQRMEDNYDFIDRIIFNIEATLPTNGKVTRQKSLVWGMPNPHEFVELPKVNVLRYAWATVWILYNPGNHTECICTISTIKTRRTLA